MRRRLTYAFVGLIIGVTTAASVLFAANAQQATTLPIEANVATSHVEHDKPQFTARTGDSFWGLHVQAVIPCSSMLVKGGGHLVILAPQTRPLEHCSYHVRDSKRVTLNDRTFELKVVGDDTIQVTRADFQELVAR